MTKKMVSTLVLIAISSLLSVGTDNANIAVAKKPNGWEAKQIAVAGDAACALTTTGSVKCWGGRLFGKWGDDENFNAGMPIAISGLESDVESIFISSSTGCAIMTNRNVKCWGSFPRYDPTSERKFNRLDGQPATDIGLQLVDRSSSILSISGSDICYRTSQFFRQCRALDLAIPSQIYGTSAPDISAPNADLRFFVSASPEYFWTSNPQYRGSGDCFVSIENDLYCYTNGSNSPEANGWKLTMRGIKDAEGPCVVTVQNSLSCYDFRQRANIEILPNDVDFITGQCIALISGGVKCFSRNYWSNGFDPLISVPDKVKEIIGSCALTVNDTLKCWGNLDVDVPGIVKARQLVVSYGGGGCAISNIGGIKCWGDNSRGQLGNGTEEITYDVVDVVGFVHQDSVTTTSTTVKRSLENSSTSSTPSDDVAIDDDWRPGKTPSGVRIEVNGRAISARMRVVGEELLLDSSVIDLSIGGGDLNSEDYSVETDSPIRLKAEDEFDLVVGNLEPDSEIEVRVFSDPVTLGNSIADSSGAATMQVKIPKALPAGSHSLVLNATSAKSEPIVLVVGIVLNKNASGLNLTFFAVVVIILGILGALLLPAMRTRKMEI